MHLRVDVPTSWLLRRWVIVLWYFGGQVFRRFANRLYANGKHLLFCTAHCFTYHILCPQRHLFVTDFLMPTWRPLPTWLRPAIHWTTGHRVVAAPQVLPQVKKTFVLVLHLLTGLRRDVIGSSALPFSFHADPYCLCTNVLQPKKGQCFLQSSAPTKTDHVPYFHRG